MNKLRIKYGKQALKQEKSHKESQLKLSKMKVKQLLALASEQDEIIKHNQKKQFRPSQSMLENAFRGLE